MRTLVLRADQRLCFSYIGSIIPPLPINAKFQVSSHFLLAVQTSLSAHAYVFKDLTIHSQPAFTRAGS